MQYNVKLLVVFISVMTIALLSFFIQGKIKQIKEENFRIQYEKIEAKTFDEITESEWHIKNKYEAMIANKNGALVDTTPYHKAMSTYLEIKNERLQMEQWERLHGSCSQEKLIEQFHIIMNFNMPYEKYNPESINIQTSGDCALNINVTTTEPKYGWKTFWVFKISFVSESNQYKLETIKKDFLGEI